MNHHSSSEKTESAFADSRRLHPDRAAGGPGDHRGPGRAAPARGAIGARCRAADAVCQQSEADRAGAAQLSPELRRLPDGGLEEQSEAGRRQLRSMVCLECPRGDPAGPGTGADVQRDQLRLRPRDDRWRVPPDERDRQSRGRRPCSSARPTRGRASRTRAATTDRTGRPPTTTIPRRAGAPACSPSSSRSGSRPAGTARPARSRSPRRWSATAWATGGSATISRTPAGIGATSSCPRP